jgi:hypothetical protein
MITSASAAQHAEMLAAVRAAGYTVQQEFTGAEGFPNAYFLAPRLREMQEDKTRRRSDRTIHFWTPGSKLLDWYGHLR